MNRKMFDIDWIREKVRKSEDYVTKHADQERMNDNLTYMEINEALLNGIIINIRILLNRVDIMKQVCHFCGNKNFKKTSVQYIYRHHQQLLIVDDVPCMQCEYCGEQYFEGNVLRQIEEEFNTIYKKGKKVKKELHVPIEHFSDLQPV